MVLTNTCNHFHRDNRSDITFYHASKPHVAERTVANPADKLI
jgi:hypothetical protein